MSRRLGISVWSSQGILSSSDSLTRIEPRAQEATARASLLLRETVLTRTPCLSHTDLESALTYALQLLVDTCPRTNGNCTGVGTRAIAESLGDVRRCDFAHIVEVGDCARDLENAMITTR